MGRKIEYVKVIISKYNKYAVYSTIFDHNKVKTYNVEFNVLQDTGEVKLLNGVTSLYNKNCI